MHAFQVNTSSGQAEQPEKSCTVAVSWPWCTAKCKSLAFHPGLLVQTPVDAKHWLACVERLFKAAPKKIKDVDGDRDSFNLFLTALNILH